MIKEEPFKISFTKVNKAIKQLQNYIAKKPAKKNKKETSQNTDIPVKVENYEIKQFTKDKNQESFIAIELKLLKEVESLVCEILVQTFRNEGDATWYSEGHPRAARQAYQYGIIDNYEIWTQLYTDLGELNYFIYDELQLEVYLRIPMYLEEFKLVLKNTKKYNKRSFYDSIKEEE